MMGQCPAPPARGDYVEVRCGAYVIVARVAWARDDRFGARAQDRIELADLVACAEGRSRQPKERRQQGRAARPARRAPTIAERDFASRHFGRAFEFGSLLFAGAALATLLGGAAHNAIAKPVASVSQALAAGESR
jgi:hypothetical protein